MTRRRPRGEPRWHWLDPRMPQPPRASAEQLARWFPQGELTPIRGPMSITFARWREVAARRMNVSYLREEIENAQETRFPVDNGNKKA